MNERSIFIEALDREDSVERRAYLDGACSGDEALRERIEKLLRSYDSAKTFLENPPEALIATIAGGERELSGNIALDFLEQSDKPGCLGTLAQYEVVDVVGRGGMGIVLRAYDTKLNRVVAIKAIAPELAMNATSVKRFLREAQAAAAVSHDHVITIHGIHDEAHLPFIVMEFTEGPSLQAKIDRTGGLDLKETLRIGMQMASGLAAAHEQGLVHRDIKPANILLENGVERVKITDFGLARAVDDVSVTKPGLIAGTPEYMSPEQARGEVVDHRSDLFSLGSVLYTMCAGRAPFKANTSIAMLRAVMEDTPPPIRDINSEVPQWLETIIAHLMAKDPNERIESAQAVSELLGTWLAHIQNPLIHEPPIQNHFAGAPRNAFARTTTVLAKPISFAVLITVYLLCIAGFTTAAAIEIESIIGGGPVCSLLGVAVAIVGWKRSRSIAAVAHGLSTVGFSLLVGLGIMVFGIGPGQAQDPVSWLIFGYSLLAIPLGLAILLTVSVHEPKGGWRKLFRFKLRTMMGVTFVAAIAFAIVRLSFLHPIGNRTDSPVALSVGFFFATTVAVGWIIVRACRESALLDIRTSPREVSEIVTRHASWTSGLVVMIGLALLAVAALLYWEYWRTNYGIVVFKSPVSDLNIEMTSGGRVVRVYDTLHGGGTRWHVPAGTWKFRVADGRTDYRLNQTVVTVKRGSFTRVQILKNNPSPPIPKQSKAWDKLVKIAEEQYQTELAKQRVGVSSAADVHRANGGLMEVKIERARALQDHQQAAELLRELVQVRELELKSVQALYRTGRITQSEVQAAMKSLVEAQVALEAATETADGQDENRHSVVYPNSAEPYDAQTLPTTEEDAGEIAYIFDSALLLMTFDEKSQYEQAGVKYVRDLSDNGNDAIANLIEFDSDGHHGQAVKLTGGNALRLDHRILPPSGPFTIAGWFDRGGLERRLPIYTEFGKPNNMDLQILIREVEVTSLQISFQYPDLPDFGTRSHTFRSRDRPRGGDWYFAAWAHDPENKSFLCVINDKWKQRAGEPELPTRSVDGSSAIGLGFGGMIDEFAIFERALTEHELSRLYRRRHVSPH
jgi:hypothetical protein